MFGEGAQPIVSEIYNEATTLQSFEQMFFDEDYTKDARRKIDLGAKAFVRAWRDFHYVQKGANQSIKDYYPRYRAIVYHHRPTNGPAISDRVGELFIITKPSLPTAIILRCIARYLLPTIEQHRLSYEPPHHTLLSAEAEVALDKRTRNIWYQVCLRGDPDIVEGEWGRRAVI